MTTLQNSCIEVIALHFERYYFKFTDTENAGLKRKFEFLQRKYSYDMVSLLYREGRMKTEYIDFFINKHLKVLDFDWLMGCSWDQIVAKFKEVGPALLKLHFRSDHRRKPLQDLMCHVPNLQMLKFEKHCTDEILKSLGKFCKNILEIEIYSSRNVTSEGIKHLCMTQDGESTGLKLRKLSISYSSDVKEGIAYLMKHMPSIEILDYMWLISVLYSMHKNDVWQIEKIQPYNLLKLEFRCGSPYKDWSALPDLLKIFASLCPRVKFLRYFLKTEKDLKFICGFRDLQYLYLDKPGDSEVETSQLLELIGGKLLFLALENVSISDVTLATSCPLLKEMDLYEVNLETYGVQPPLFSALDKCTFRHLHAGSVQTVRHLFRISPKLEDVTFRQCDFQSSLLLKAIIIELFQMKCVKNPIKRLTFIGAVEKTFIRDILLTCYSLRNMTLSYSHLKDGEKLELKTMAQSLRNRPKVVFIYENFYEGDSWLSYIF